MDFNEQGSSNETTESDLQFLKEFSSINIKEEGINICESDVQLAKDLFPIETNTLLSLLAETRVLVIL